MVIGSAGVRIVRPWRSAGVLIGFLLLVMWRMPLSHQPSGTMPTPANFSASSVPIGPSSTLKAAALSWKRNGSPSVASSGTRPEAAPWLLAVMSSAPVRRLVSMATSLPSCSEPAMFTVTRPSDFSLTSLAKASAARVRGLPGAAPCPSVSVVAAKARRRKIAGAASTEAVPASTWRRVSCIVIRCLPERRSVSRAGPAARHFRRAGATASP